MTKKHDSHEPEGLTRRNLCLGAGGAAALFALGGLRYLGQSPAVRPPGGQDEERLMSACIRCGKCLEACPHKIVRPQHLEEGLAGMRTPYLCFDDGWCDWCAEANEGAPLCIEVCPTRALELPAEATPETVILGKAVLREEWCLAYKKLTECRWCYNACPYEAIEMDADNRPVVIPEKCNGCGACEAACISLQGGSLAEGMTSRAIVVVPEEA